MLTLTVTTLADEAAGTDIEALESLDGSGLALREAIAVALSAATGGEAVEIVFDPSLAGGTITLDLGALVVDFDLTIHGDALEDGTGDITLAAGDQYFLGDGLLELQSGTIAIDNLTVKGAADQPPVTSPGAASLLSGIAIGADAVVALDSMEITDNWLSGDDVAGGGIRNYGTLTLTNSAVTGNGAGSGQAGGSGGGIYNAGDLTMDTVEVSGNSSSGRVVQPGAGIHNDGVLRMTSSLVTGNTGGLGAGVYNTGEMIAVNSTIALNTIGGARAGAGSGIENEGDLTLTHTTVAGHQTDDPFYGPTPEINGSGDVRLVNSIVYDSSDGAAVTGGMLTLDGGNIVGRTLYDEETALGTTSADALFWDGITLNDNGGPLPTINLRSSFTNPAVDAGDSSLATDVYGNPLTTDARGLTRDVDHADYGGGPGGSIDLGAVERQTLDGDLVIDGETYRVRTYGREQDFGDFDVTADGSAITLSGNAWKVVSTFRMTEDLMLSFDFSSTDEGEVQGIAFMTQDGVSAGNTFQLLGSQLYGNQDYAGQASADGTATRFEIAAGALVDDDLIGEWVSLVFINDDDAGPSANATFADLTFETTGDDLALLAG
ncbi:choice-of-anchor Q domain-containing protein [Acuticoccus yangtzensis]|uniref:choice-of-anchor Q domain-containing protein n=1 Tax=Acuticoccus yangtzensis TaxID=1443441 RepID=UPI0009496CD3|nr:choice-of-anchor Q domain-containing protein [Acuticoccus yangtzensis]